MELLHDWIIKPIKWLIGLADPVNLGNLVATVGVVWVYAILFAIIFSETGLLVGFFLPGDSLLFATGMLASRPEIGLDIWYINGLLIIAAIVGDAVNFFLGVQLGERVLEKGRLRFVKHDHLMAAQKFYERHGGKAIILARFVPLVRTFTPFVAGVARMSYLQFAAYNVIGGVLWVVLMTMAGYFLGNIPFIKNNFEAVVLTIIAISVLPVFIGGYRHWKQKRLDAEATPAEQKEELAARDEAVEELKEAVDKTN